LVTLLLSKKCSRESLNNSLLCSEEKLSSIGILVKVWMRWNSLKLNLTWTIWYLNINNIKMLLLKKKSLHGWFEGNKGCVGAGEWENCNMQLGGARERSLWMIGSARGVPSCLWSLCVWRERTSAHFCAVRWNRDGALT
jgi:hypothetical protein